MGVASPPENMDAHSSSPSADRCLVNGGGAIPNLEGARNVEGYPQGLGPESLLSKDCCRVMPIDLPPLLEDGNNPKGGRGLVEG